MKSYVTIEIGDVPSGFGYCTREFYRCLAFTALVIARNQEGTGYKELEKAGIASSYLMRLGIIKYATRSGSFKLTNPKYVTYNDIKNPVIYHLDVSAFGRVNVTDVLINRDETWLINQEDGMEYDVDIFNSLPDGAQDWFINAIQFNSSVPAAELLDNLKRKILSKDITYNKDMLNELPSDKQKWFLEKVEKRDFSAPSAQVFLDKIYTAYQERLEQEARLKQLKEENERAFKESIAEISKLDLPETVYKMPKIEFDQQDQYVPKNAIPIEIIDSKGNIIKTFKSKREACDTLKCNLTELNECIKAGKPINGLLLRIKNI